MCYKDLYVSAILFCGPPETDFGEYLTTVSRRFPTETGNVTRQKMQHNVGMNLDNWVTTATDVALLHSDSFAKP